jgi:hypothetical protein
MNIRKTTQFNFKEEKIEILLMYITKVWRNTTGYKTRGYKNRVSRVAKSRTIKDNLDITQHVKRNRVYHLVKPTIK